MRHHIIRRLTQAGAGKPYISTEETTMSRITRRALLMGCTVPALASYAWAQPAYPSRPIRILVGFGAGGGVDTLARIYGQKLSELLNTPVIVENKPGASELQAVLPLIKAQPDGYTLWMSSASGLARNPSVRNDLPYDPLKNLTFIGRVADIEALIVVRPGLAVNSVAELIRFAKANPGKLNYGSAGVGASNHLWTEQLKMLTQTDMVHVPYKSDADVARELAGGTLDVALAIPTFAVPFVKDGRIRAIGVTGPQRLDALPEVPRLDESGVAELRGLGSYLFYGLVGPTGLPAEVVQKLSDGLNRISRMPETVQTLQGLHYRATSGSPAEARQTIENEVRRWKEIGKTVKIST